MALVTPLSGFFFFFGAPGEIEAQNPMNNKARSQLLIKLMRLLVKIWQVQSGIDGVFTSRYNHCPQYVIRFDVVGGFAIDICFPVL